MLMLQTHHVAPLESDVVISLPPQISAINQCPKINSTLIMDQITDVKPWLQYLSTSVTQCSAV